MVDGELPTRYLVWAGRNRSNHREDNMNNAAITALVQSSINNRCLPFPIRAAVIRGFIALTVTIKDQDGITLDQRVIIPVPSDLVIMTGLDGAIYKAVTKGNSAQHMGLEVV
jgi:hypothetical protein